CPVLQQLSTIKAEQHHADDEPDKSHDQHHGEGDFVCRLYSGGSAQTKHHSDSRGERYRSADRKHCHEYVVERTVVVGRIHKLDPIRFLMHSDSPYIDQKILQMLNPKQYV